MNTRRPITRFATAVAIAVAAIVASLAPASPAATAPAAGEAPNILIIVTDDQRVGTMSAMPKTLNWLAKHGIEYSNAYATTPLCCPSRASIMTGLYAHNHGVTTNGSGENFPARQSVQAKLQAAGYATGIVGKYLNGWPTADNPPHFDKWAITKTGVNEPDTTYNINGQIETIERYKTNVLGDQAVSFLDGWELTADETPWLLYVAFTAPHRPYVAAKKYREAAVPAWTDKPPHEANRSDKPPYILERDGSPDEARHIRKQQLRMLMSVDDAVAKIRDALVPLGERGDTLVVFTSDNGLTWGEHGVVGEKRVPYTPSVQVPMYLRWPGVSGAGLVHEAPVANIDVAVTALEAAGLPTADLDGKNLLTSAREKLFLELPAEIKSNRWTVPVWASIRTTDWQYTVYFEGEAIVFREYYDLATDPHQLKNIAGQIDTTALDAEVLALRSCAGATCP